VTGDAILFAIGLMLLIGGAESLVRGASGLGRAAGASPLVIGVTVVAFVTSAPELAVNLFASWRRETNIAFGNVIGSNMANVGLILGLCGLLGPIPIGRRQLERRMLALATLATIGLSLDDWLGRPPAQFDRTEGIGLLLLCALFLYYTVSIARREQLGRSSPSPEDTTAGGGGLPCLLLIVLGLVLLTIGAHFALAAAVDLAHAFRVSEALIGLTLVAVGTSLPELVTCLVAMRHGEARLIVGTLLGSNVFNLLLVLGASALIRPVPIPIRGLCDLVAMAVLSGMVLLFAVSGGQRIGRIKATVLLGVYAAYLGWRIW
jgi:cation:H+ antiporter